jgi:hypothetical protein
MIPSQPHPDLYHQKVHIQVLELLYPIHITVTFRIILPENLQRIDCRVQKPPWTYCRYHL